jgi:hypothetical protein
MLILFMQRTRFRALRSFLTVVAFILVAMLGSPFSGFGTLGLVHSSEDRAHYTAGPLAPNGAGFTHDWSPDIDSRLGAQVIAHFTPQLSAMLQVISEQRYDKTFRPHVEWANIAYQPAPESVVRLGRAT